MYGIEKKWLSDLSSIYITTLWYKVSSFLDEDFNQRSVMIYGEILFRELIPKGFFEKNRKGHFLNININISTIHGWEVETVLCYCYLYRRNPFERSPYISFINFKFTVNLFPLKLVRGHQENIQVCSVCNQHSCLFCNQPGFGGIGHRLPSINRFSISFSKRRVDLIVMYEYQHTYTQNTSLQSNSPY